MALSLQYKEGMIEAGVDEAGRGCLAGPVVAAAVILPAGFSSDQINDSKKLNARQRNELRGQIQSSALAWAIGIVGPQRIDEINILKASHEAMVLAIEGLKIKPETLAIDGNRFVKYSIPAHCIIKGDGKFLNIAAASILAKTKRDEIMESLHDIFPSYGWKNNKGYPTGFHRKAILENGVSPHHRKTFQLLAPLTLF